MKTVGGEAMPASNGEVVVRMKGITKRFGPLLANDAADFDLRPGEVHALLGENGAGKTTLMNVLSGILRPDAGTITVDGERVSLRSPKDSLDVGIGMVHQHFRVFDGLTVAENIYAGWSETPTVFRRGRSLPDRARDLVDRYGLALKPDAAVWQLSVGEKQRVEIVRTLARGAKVLILDEPTAVLTPSEAATLFQFMDTIRRAGTAVVFISHKLPEVLAVADRITVMRSGRHVRTVDRQQASIELLTQLIVQEAIPHATREPAKLGGEVLSLTSVSALDDERLLALRRVSLKVHSGEIVGVAGVSGNGQRELSEVLTGMRGVTEGRITVAGEDLSSANPRDFIAAGVGSVPEDRLTTGLARSQTIWRNAVLRTYRRPPIGRHGLLSKKKAKEYARQLARTVELSVDDVDQEVRGLSGGHAQRLLTGREMDIASRALVLAYPTRGLDIKATEALHAAILRARAAGVATLLISEDLDELLEMSDRIVVLCEGAVVGSEEAGAASKVSIGALMCGTSAASCGPEGVDE